MAASENNIRDEEQSSQDTQQLTDALSPADEEFVVTEQKQQLSKGTLAIFGLALAAGVLVYFMYLKTGPGSAEAATPEVQAADETINQFLSASGSNIKMMEEMLRNTERVVEQFRAYPSMKQIPLSDLQTNPFKFHELDGAPDDAVAKKKREEERAAALKAVQGLALQSVMHSGAHKACMINNSMYREGEQVEQFTIERITTGSVIVRTGVYRFELKMQ